MPTSLAGRPSTCSLGLPVVLQTLDVSAEHRRAWKARALSHGIDSFHVQPGVNATDVATMSTHVPPKLSSLRLTEDDQRMALKKIAMWVVQRGFHARVASGEWGSDGAVLLEDDVHLDAHFCARVSRALGALPADGAWDVLFLGHCGESYGGIRSCNRTARQPAEFLSRGAHPMCTHAFAVSPRGASRLHRLLAGWPLEYVDAVAAKPGSTAPHKKIRARQRPRRQDGQARVRQGDRGVPRVAAGGAAAVAEAAVGPSGPSYERHEDTRAVPRLPPTVAIPGI